MDIPLQDHFLAVTSWRLGYIILGNFTDRGWTVQLQLFRTKILKCLINITCVFFFDYLMSILKEIVLS